MKSAAKRVMEDILDEGKEAYRRYKTAEPEEKEQIKRSLDILDFVSFSFSF